MFVVFLTRIHDTFELSELKFLSHPINFQLCAKTPPRLPLNFQPKAKIQEEVLSGPEENCRKVQEVEKRNTFRETT